MLWKSYLQWMYSCGGVGICPFCRTPTPETDKEIILRLQKRVDIGDAEAMFSLGSHYSHGLHGLPQDMNKTSELWHRATELGHTTSCYNIGCWYLDGNGGVKRDMKKANHYWELAAMKGCPHARHNLGVLESNEGNTERALKHYTIAIESGFNSSLIKI